MTRALRLLSALLLLVAAPARTAPPPATKSPAPTKQPTPPKQDMPPQRDTTVKQDAPVADARPVRGTRVSLVPPPGFVESSRFSGFQNDATASSILVTELPAAYAEVSAAFEAEPMARKGMKLLERQSIDGGQALLVHLEQDAGGVTFRKWMLAVGDAKVTALVTGSFRKELEATESAPMRAAILSARRNLETAAPPLDPTFTLTVTPGLRQAQQVQNALLYTSDGKLEGLKPEDPLLVAAPSLGNPGALDARAFSEKRIQLTAGVKEVTVESGAPLEVNGMKGYELVALAKDAKTDAALVLHQVLLLEEGGYFLLQGRVGVARRAEYLPHFQAVARGLQRKP
ncbi:hypothetical protein P2318_02245 [Myxococcaceae bacterium GXIMD 01537]